MEVIVYTELLLRVNNNTDIIKGKNFRIDVTVNGFTLYKDTHDDESIVCSI